MMNRINSNISEFPALKARKAVILARVSSKEQEEGYSIEAQKHRLETYCARRDLNVIKTFEIVESSTSGDRKHFMAMVKFVKSQKETIALVADKVDRVQRSFKEYPLLDELIQKGKIELHFNTENYVIHKDSASQERLMWSMGVIMAQSYIDSMRDNVKRSIDQKIRLGEWIGRAPIGYLNVKNEKGRGDVIVDPERAPLVVKLFETYATGAHTLSEMVTMARNWDLKAVNVKNPPNRSYIHALLQNPFYYGFMRIKGQIYEHRYERLISKELFDQCQAVMKGWHKKQFKYGGKEYIFRGLIRCAATGKLVSTDQKTRTYKNGNTATWTYLRAWKPEDPTKKHWVREEIVLDQVQSVFDKLSLPADAQEYIEAYLRDTQHSERGFIRRQVKEWQEAYSKSQDRLDTLMDLLLDGTVERQDFEEKKAKIRLEQIKLEDHIKSARQADDSFKVSMLNLLAFLRNAGGKFKGATVAQKRYLINFVFSNLELDGENLRYSLKKPFDQMLDLTDMKKWRVRQDSNLRPRAPEARALSD